MLVQSNWKLTLDPSGTPKVLLNFGDKIDEELSFPLKLGLEVVDLTDSPAPFLRPTKNNTVEISWTVYSDQATDKDSRVEVMNSLIAVMAYTRKPLRIEVSGHSAGYWQFANAFIKEFEPRRHLNSPIARAAKIYSATCTGLTYTATP